MGKPEMTVMQINLDTETAARLKSLVESRHQSQDSILSEALRQYLTREENPAGKNYPQRTPIGGIITPV
ncbi:MAG: ribbon-helix-helix protein, CopG family [Silvibacterium sp.]